LFFPKKEKKKTWILRIKENEEFQKRNSEPWGVPPISETRHAEFRTSQKYRSDIAPLLYSSPFLGYYAWLLCGLFPEILRPSAPEKLFLYSRHCPRPKIRQSEQ
jgi:hypothetical protein